jgi:hypothetical protein
MDASDASIKRQLLGIQDALLNAYDQGPEEILVFMKTWTDLKDRLIAAASAKLLSPETLQLAADVAKPVARIATSLHALDKARMKTSADLVRDSTEQVSSLEDDEDSGESSCSDSASIPDAEELPSAEDEDDEPCYVVLRDWFFAHIGHPFAADDNEYSDMLKIAKINRAQFLEWLEFVRNKSGWSRLFHIHARSNPHYMENLCQQVFDELDKGVSRVSSAVPPAIYDDFRQLRIDVERIYPFNFSDWWDPINRVFEEAGLGPWNDLPMVEEWFSDDEYLSDEIYDGSDSEDEEFYSQDRNLPFISRNDQPAALIPHTMSESSEVRNLKRKAIEMSYPEDYDFRFS